MFVFEGIFFFLIIMTILTIMLKWPRRHRTGLLINGSVFFHPVLQGGLVVLSADFIDMFEPTIHSFCADRYVCAVTESSYPVNFHL